MRDLIKRLVALSLFSLALCGMTQCTTSSEIVCDEQGCISKAKLSEGIASTLRGGVVGYISIVGGIPPALGGEARTSTDPPSTPMEPELETNIASVSKMLTAIGVLKSLSKNHLTIDSFISPYIYPDWIQGPNISTITFRDLLTHKAGIRADCDGSHTNYAVLKALVARGVDPEDKTSASYNNCNFALFRELLPVMEGAALTSLSDGPRAQASARLYISYMNQNVFQPLGIRLNGAAGAQCMPPPPGTPDILSYPFPAGAIPGVNWGDWTLACGGGGWVLSANDLFKIVDDLASGNVLLQSAEKTEMFNDCLGWDCSVRSDCPDPHPCKNGSLHNGNNVTLWTFAGIVNCRVPVVVIVNSVLPPAYESGNDIIGVVADAYKKARTSGMPRPCP